MAVIDSRFATKGHGQWQALWWLLLACWLLVPVFAAADDGIGPAAARAALVDVLGKHGLAPPAGSALTLADYIDMRISKNAGGDTDVRLLVPLGPGGHLIPNRDWRNAHPEYCRMRARETAEPERWLRFKMFRNHEAADAKNIRGLEGLEGLEGRIVRNQYAVFTSIVESNGVLSAQVETQVTEAWQELVPSPVGDATGRVPLAQAFTEGLNQLGADIGAPRDGCGEIRLQHLYGNEVGQPAGFLAGYKGYYGSTLSYAWDFGDGSASQQPQSEKEVEHVYDAAGRYQVTVHVSGKGVEPGSGTIAVKIGQSLVLDFSSEIQVSGNTPQRSFRATAAIELEAADDGSLSGQGRLNNAGVSIGPALGQVGCAAGSTHDGGTMRVRVLPSGGQGGAPSVRIAIPRGPGVEVSCGPELPALVRSRIEQRIGDTWWLGFSHFHAQEQVGSHEFEFAQWDRADPGSLAASRLYQSTAHMDDSQISETTVIQLRAGGDSPDQAIALESTAPTMLPPAMPAGDAGEAHSSPELNQDPDDEPNGLQAQDCTMLAMQGDEAGFRDCTQRLMDQTLATLKRMGLDTTQMEQALGQSSAEPEPVSRASVGHESKPQPADSARHSLALACMKSLEDTRDTTTGAWHFVFQNICDQPLHVQLCVVDRPQQPSQVRRVLLPPGETVSWDFRSSSEYQRLAVHDACFELADCAEPAPVGCDAG